MTEQLVFKREGKVVTLTLNRPAVLNALTRGLLRELAVALKKLAGDDTVRAVILTGAGRGFCAGQDLGEVQEEPVPFRRRLNEDFNPVIQAITNLPKPVIAAVNGAAAGAGMSLALACDLRLAADTASFTTAFTRLGLVPDCGMSATLPRLVGVARAFELLVTSPRVTAVEAAGLGLVNRVVPAADLPRETAELALSLAQGPTRAYGLLKQALRKGMTTPLEEVLEYEAYLQEIAGRSADHQEGKAAFLEKRFPRFEGR